MECSTVKTESSFYEIVCPFETEWKFQKADLIALKDSEERYLNGKCFYAFNIPGLQYNVRIFPNGDDNEERRGQTCIYLRVNGSKERKITAEFTISIESANFSTSCNSVHEAYIGAGKRCFKIDEFFDSKNNYFVNGEVTIKVNGFLKAHRSLISLRTCLFLHIELGKYKKVEAVFDFSIVSANCNCDCQFIYEESYGYGICLCSKEELFDPSMGYIVDGYLTINCNGVLMVEKNEPTVLNCKNGVAPKSYLKKKDKDFAIFVGDKKIYVHKHVLMEVSPVWNAMLESGMKEAIENKMIITDFPFEIVVATIKLCYSSNVPQKFDLEDILLIYRFADKYEIKLITANYLIKHISPSNVVHLIHFTNSFIAAKLHQSCVDFLIKCAKESVAVFGSESLDKDLVFKMFMSALRSNLDTCINA
uniref:BTB domain-containing protein n=1 Tax=Panagrolaimus sp. ES5 TaxID=591445 RepID=A0AC34GXQ9_9BILA